MSNQATQKRAVVVLLACILFNLTIGVLYAWSVLKSKMTSPIVEGGWEWTASQSGMPYTFAILFTALFVLVGGRIQDKLGPRWVVTAGALFTGAGLILSGFVGNSVIGVTFCFGVITGIGIGLGYSSVTPPALKWFHPSKKGLISGLIVGGFGLAAVYIAPLSNTLLNGFGIEKTMLYLGIGALVIGAAAAQFVRNPPPDHIPAVPAKIKQAATAAKPTATVNFSPKEMMKTTRFCLMFVIFLVTASVGLMFIGNMTKIARTQADISDTAVLAALVAFLAITNSGGRVVGGMLSDKIGRTPALYMVLIIQMLNMAAFTFYSTLPMVIVGIIGVGFCFGTLLSVFPAMTADQFGLKNFGVNYGIMFMAWGFSGLAAPVIADYFYDLNGNFNTAYIICSVMMAVMIVVNFLLTKNVKALAARAASESDSD